MKKKGIYITLLVFAILPALQSCDPDPDSGETEDIIVSEIKAALIFPNDAGRWGEESVNIQASLETAGVETEVYFSGNSTETELANVSAAAAADCSLLLLTVVDLEDSIPAISSAKTAGMTVILYDRPVFGVNDADYYISYDNYDIGVTQAQALLDAANNNEVNGVPLYLYTGALSDYNSWFFFAGSWSVLQPAIAEGIFIPVNSSMAAEYADKTTLNHDEIEEIIEETTTDWNISGQVTEALVEQNILDYPPEGTLYILAPNDYTSRIIGDAFRAVTEVDALYISGQDGEIDSVQYFLEEKQSMTLVKKVSFYIDTAVTLLSKLHAKEIPLLSPPMAYGSIDIPFVHVPFIPIHTVDDLHGCIELGIYTEDDFSWPPE